MGTWVLKTNIKGYRGLTGEVGAQGLPGVNAVANDTATAGYIGTAGASATKTALLAKLPSVNVKDYGAVGDWNPTTASGTNDTAAIQAAINAAGTRAVLFPAGNFYVTASLVVASDDQSFIGGGGIITAPATVNIFTTVKQRTRFEGLRTAGGRDVFTAGVEQPAPSVGGDFMTVRSCTATGPVSFVSAWYADHVRVLDCEATDIKSSGVMFWGGNANPSDGSYPGNGVYNTRGGLVQGNRFAGVAGSASSTSCPTWTTCATGVRVIGNHFTTFYDVGIDFESSANCVAIGNVVIDCAQGGLSLFFSSVGNLFEGNIVIGTSAQTDSSRNRVGVFITGEASGACNDNVFRGNKFSIAQGFGYRGVFMDSGVHLRNVFEGNEFTNGDFWMVNSQDTIIRGNVFRGGGITNWGCDRTLIVGNQIITTATSPAEVIALTQVPSGASGSKCVVRDNTIRTGSGGVQGRISVVNSSVTAAGHIIMNNLTAVATTLTNADGTTTQSGNVVVA